MTIQFYKYQGTGNDFVMIDNRDKAIDSDDIKFVQTLCERKFGIGADGLILIENHETTDFELIYFNSDGSKSLCGNGSRCGVMFARQLGIIQDKTTFMAIDGVHEAFIDDRDWVHLLMLDLDEVEQSNNHAFLDTGSPHYVLYEEDLDTADVVQKGKDVRYNERFATEGTNVNFVELEKNNTIKVRTYERGVEDETLSCGTGVTACSLAVSNLGYESPVAIETKGGQLEVSFERISETEFKNIYLIGPAKLVYSGSVEY